MRHIIVGDVHGMLPELQSLIAGVSPAADDVLVFAGDLLDKGPDSAGVVKFVRGLAESHQVVLVEGNHEDKHRRFRRNKSLRPEVAATMAEKQPELDTITSELSPDDVEFLEQAVPFHRIDQHGILIVHAGIPGDMTEFPATLAEAANLTGKRKKKFGLIMRTRHIYAETGKMLALGTETEADPFWAETHDGRFGHVVFGHQPFMDGPGEFPHATGIDTGAVFGGSLTAMVVADDGARSFQSVQSRKMAEPGFH